MEVPLSYLIARHRACGVRLIPRPPRFKVPEKKKEPEKISDSVAMAKYEREMFAKEFMAGDYQYWVGVPPATEMIICRVCQRPVRNDKVVRKNHLRTGNCSAVMKELEKRLRAKDCCVVCGWKEGETFKHLWHWGLKFCSVKCQDEFRFALALAKPVVDELVDLRLEFGI